MKTYKIYLIRHGLTEANTLGQYLGQSRDVDLSPEGIEALRSLKEQYVYPPAGRLYVSPALRCRRTASILYPDMEQYVNDLLLECHFGEFEGRTFDELCDSDVFMRWFRGESEEIPGGEDNGVFFARCRAAYESVLMDMMARRDSEAVVVTHGGVIMAMLTELAYPKQPFAHWAVANGMGYETLVNTQLWMRGQVIEATTYLPYGSVMPKEEMLKTYGVGDDA